jgi:hypothetical protein
VNPLPSCSPYSRHLRTTLDSPYIKGLPITLTILEADANGHFQERIVRPTYKVRCKHWVFCPSFSLEFADVLRWIQDAYTLELEELYKCVAEGMPCMTSPTDAAQDLHIFDMILGSLRS